MSWKHPEKAQNKEKISGQVRITILLADKQAFAHIASERILSS